MNDFNATPVPRVSQDPKDPAFSANPYPFYSEIRALGDFVYWEDLEMIVATTHVASTAVLRSQDLGRERPAERKSAIAAELGPFERLEKYSLLELEPPEHTRLRQIAMAGMGRERVAPMGPRISNISDALIDAFPSGEFDLLEAFAKPLPAIAIANFLGVPEEMAPQLQSWSNDMVAMYQSRRDTEIEQRAATASQEFRDYLSDYIKVRRASPGNGFLDDLIALEADGQSMSEDELISTVVLLLNAGHEATVHTIGSAVSLVADHPDRALILSPPHIADTVEECLRFKPPLHLFTRFAKETTDVMGCAIQKGQEIGCLLGSACRDDSVWPDADKFDPFRARRQHLAFGSGIHVCIGASLARLELQIALPVLFSRCPKLRLSRTPKDANLYHFHGFETLWATVK